MAITNFQVGTGLGSAAFTAGAETAITVIYITNKIDYSLGYISRTPDNDDRVKNPYRPMSIVVDCYK